MSGFGFDSIAENRSILRNQPMHKQQSKQV